MEYGFVLWKNQSKINILIPMLTVSNLEHRKYNQGDQGALQSQGAHPAFYTRSIIG